jgi:hypothetical protein
MLGIWADSLDHLVHLVVALIDALWIGWNRERAASVTSRWSR